MAITFQDATVTRNESSITTFSVNMPGTISVGDLLLASVSGGAGKLIAPPAGWTLLRSLATGLAGHAIAYRVADGTESASYNFTFSAAGRGNAIVVRLSGVDTADPIDDWAGGGAASNTTSHVAASAYAFGTDRMLVSCVSGGWNGFTYTTTGVTERADSANTGGSSSGSSMAVGTEALASSGATGTRTWTCSAALNYSAINVVVRPSGAAARSRGLLHSRERTVQTAASTTFTLNLPSGVADGDLLVAVIGGGASQSITPPVGWTTVQTLAYGGANGGVYSKVASSEPSSYAFSFSQSRPGIGECLLFRGAGTPSIDVSDEDGFASNSATATAPTVTPTAEATLVTAILGGWGAGVHLVTPGGHIKVAEADTHLASGNGSTLGIGIEAPVPASATGTRTWTFHSPIPYGAATLAVVDAGGGNTAPVVQINLPASIGAEMMEAISCA